MQQMSGKQMALGLGYLLGVVALWVWLGYQAASPWAGLIGFAAFVMIQVALSRGVSDKFSGVVVLEWLGFWGISAAGTMAEYAGRWLWIIPWVLAGLMLILTGAVCTGKASWASWSGYVLGIWSLGWAAVGPVWLYGKNQEETRAFFTGLLKDWWWVLLVAFAVLVVLIFAVSLARAAREVRRQERAGLPGPRLPAEPGASLGDNPLFGQQLPPGPPSRPLAAPGRQEPAPAEHEPAGAGPEATVLAGGGTPAGAGPDAGAGATVLAAGEGLAAGAPGPGAGDQAGGTSPTVLAGQAGGDQLYRLPADVVDFAARDGDHFLLTGQGHLARRHGGVTADVPGVELDRPLGLSAAGEVVVAAGAAAQFVSVRYPGGGAAEVQHYDAGEELACFALNPYGTIVAYAPARQGGIHALVLATGDRQALTGDGQVTTAMAFSADGRILGLGDGDGGIRLFDMATRQVTGSFPPPAGEHGRVVSLVPEPAGGWVAGYASGRVAHWDGSGLPAGLVTESHQVSSLAVEPGSGRVAVACDDGYVIVHPADLDSEICDRALGGDRIVRVVFDRGGRALVAADRGGSVRRTEV